MIKILVQTLISILIIFYEGEKGLVRPDFLIFSVLFMFSYVMLVSILPQKNLKLALFLLAVLFLLFNPDYTFLSLILAVSAYDHVREKACLIFLPFLSDMQAIYLFSTAALLLTNVAMVKKDETISALTERRLDLIEKTESLGKSIDMLKIEKERDETLLLQDERNRISREIHDTAGHTLSAAIIHLKALSLISKEDEVKENALELKAFLEKGLQDIRHVMYDLRESSFDLENKILELLEKVENANLTYRVKSHLEYTVKYDIYGIIKEALTNYYKHSNGKYFKVYLVESEKFIILKIEDDGTAIAAEIKEGLGLYSIRQKCNQRGWQFHLVFDQGFSMHIRMEKKDENTGS